MLLQSQVGSIMDSEEKIGEKESLAILSSNHEISTGKGWHAEDQSNR